MEYSYGILGVQPQLKLMAGAGVAGVRFSILLTLFVYFGVDLENELHTRINK